MGSSGCRFSGRAGHGRIGATRKRAAGHHDHVEECAECRARQQRERQYLEKLRGAAVPEASQDLTARLLARTEQLAAERADAEKTAAAPSGSPDRARPVGPAPAAYRPGGRRSGLRLPVVAAGGAFAALALMAGTAYVMGDDTVVLASSSGAPAPLNAAPPAALPSDPIGDVSGAGEEARPGLGLNGEPDLTPAGALSAEQLAALRSQGWTCPELRDLGFHLMWARAGVMSGSQVVELRLTDGQHFATVVEQHASSPRTPGTPPAPAPADSSPVNVLTGHTAAADGFTLAGAGTGTPVSGNGTLWVNDAPPYRAIYRTSAATYTYISDLPAGQADDGAAALARAGGAVPEAAAHEGIPERIERGLARILGHLAS
ncbi:hypothetical protein [Arthrobacter sp. PM3]|uniref:hypothetical protein n=1 Tax=Arthrobacter sp. PM3 TaxID=2017685 RepID=UPI000E10C9FF|nr:hypothetical protein [Arthrobacter sp. PM3]AXJ11534.1 hypothetical protein CFN17_19410 [Arthrobacter sp. PM3]